MFAIHGKVELLKKGQPLGTSSFHYDLFQLAGQSDVMAMLKSAEYDAIKKDYDLISRERFPRQLFLIPPICASRTVTRCFPPAELSSVIAPEYEAQCRMLCYGAFPPSPKVQQRFVELRDLL